MNDKIYVISKATNKDGSLKDIPSSWYKDYAIYTLEVGVRATLNEYGGGTYLTTSKVEGITYREGIVIIETLNTIYHLKLKVGK